MEMKGAFTMNPQSAERIAHSEDDFRYYFPCPLRKNHARIPVTVCHKQKCLWLTTDGEKLHCGYGDPNAKLCNRPKVKKIHRDGIF